MMHQLITLEAVVVAKVITFAGVTGIVGGAFVKCFPPTPSIMMNIITLGNQTMLSYLVHDIGS